MKLPSLRELYEAGGPGSWQRHGRVSRDLEKELHDIPELTGQPEYDESKDYEGQRITISDFDMFTKIDKAKLKSLKYQYSKQGSNEELFRKELEDGTTIMFFFSLDEGWGQLEIIVPEEYDGPNVGRMVKRTLMQSGGYDPEGGMDVQDIDVRNM